VNTNIPHPKFLLTMKDVCGLTGYSEDTVRRDMQKGLRSRLQNGRRFLTKDVMEFYRLNEPAPSRIATRISRDSDELPASILRSVRKSAFAA
jgi:hypothetical protein